MNSVVDRVTWQLGVGEGWWPWLLAGVLAALLITLGARAVVNQPRRRKIILISLRVALAIAVVLMALRLETQRVSVSVTSAPVAIIVDTSESMGVRDQPGSGGLPGGQATRLDAALAWLRGRDAALAELASRTSVDLFAASGGTLTSLGGRDELATITPSGSTDLLGSLRALAERHAGRRRPTVLLLSDGADHGELARAVESGLKGPALASLIPPGGGIVAVAPERGGFVDRSVELVERDPVGFLRTDITVRARVRSIGLPAGEIPVSLLRGDDIVQVRSIHVGPDAPSDDVTFLLGAQSVGEALYRVQVPLAAGEAVPSNNEAPFSVRIVRDRIRVLQVVGRPSWDGRFLRELLKRDPAVDLISFFILRSQHDDTNADVDELSLIPFPVAELFDEKLSSFDLVIFQNFSLVPHGIEPYADSIARVVREHGSGLAIVGGDLALGREWAGPELAAILPLRVATGSASGFDPGSARLELAPGGERHPIMLLGGDEDPATLLAALPEVGGLHRGLVPKPSASVLLQTADAAKRPIVVAGDAGAGRVLVVGTDGTWRWSLPMAGKTGSARAYEQFWENALRWLVKDERSSLLLLEAERRSLAPGESVEVRAALRSPSYQPEPGASVTLTLRDATGATLREESLKTADDGIARLVFEPKLPGVYAVTATSATGGSAGPLHIEVADRSGEMTDASTRPDILEALAAATGGRVLSSGSGGSDLPLSAEREERVESSDVRALWRTWPAWLLVAGLACVEWWLRRRWGLA